MKKRIFVKVAGVENENLSKINEVKNAIETIRRFARDVRNLTESCRSIDETAVMQGKVDAENNLYLRMTIEVEGLEDILGNIATLTEKIKTEIEKMDKAIIIGMEKEPVKN